MSIERHVRTPEETVPREISKYLQLDDEGLYARLGQIALAAREPGVEADQLVWQDSKSFDELCKFGRRIFKAWQIAVRSMLCGDGADATRTRDKVRAALGAGDKSAAAAVVAAMLTRYLGIDVTTSALVGVLTYQIIFKPLGEEFCNSWNPQQETTPDDAQ